MTPQSTNRSYDMQGEQIIGEFLDKHFYPHLYHQGFERVKDKTRQIAGIDVVLNIDDNVFLIDEKASTDYTDGRLIINGVFRMAIGFIVLIVSVVGFIGLILWLLTL